MKNITPERVREIAAQEARNVAATGSPGADTHNTTTIEHAINVALKEAQSSTVGWRMSREQRFKEKGHSEAWRDGIAKDLNDLLDRAQYFRETSNDKSDKDTEKATLRIVARVAEFENIEKA